MHELLLAVHATAQRHSGVTANIVPKKKPVKLSQQQALVLELLAQGRCNADIVAEMGLSLSTVKATAAAPQAGRAHRHGRHPEGPRAGPAGVGLLRWGSRSGRGALPLS